MGIKVNPSFLNRILQYRSLNTNERPPLFGNTITNDKKRAVKQ